MEVKGFAQGPMAKKRQSLGSAQASAYPLPWSQVIMAVVWQKTLLIFNGPSVVLWRTRNFRIREKNAGPHGFNCLYISFKGRLWAKEYVLQRSSLTPCLCSGVKASRLAGTCRACLRRPLEGPGPQKTRPQDLTATALATHSTVTLVDSGPVTYVELSHADWFPGDGTGDPQAYDVTVCIGMFAVNGTHTWAGGAVKPSEPAAPTPTQE